jgi:PAS domain S-box-containing protein
MLALAITAFFVVLAVAGTLLRRQLRIQAERRAAVAKAHLLARALQSAHDCISITDTSDRILYVNEAFLRTYEYEEDDLIGQHISVVRAFDNPLEVGDAIATATKPNGWRGVIRNRSKHGRVFPVSLTTSTVHDDRGAAIALVGVARDMTDEDAAAHALRASEERYREVVESANDIIFTVDPGGYCLSMNRAGREITGYVADNSRGINLRQIVVPEQADIATQQLQRVLEGATVPRFELDIFSKSGARLTLELDVRPVLGEGRITGVQGIARDVTARKELEAQLGQSQKLEAIGRLAGGVAHDFNNILTVVIGFAELATEQLDPSSPVRRDIEEIQRAADSATSLTRQLLIFSRKNIVHPTVLAPDVIVRRLDTMLRRLVGEHIEFIVRPDCVLGHIRADAGQIEQVVLNLVVNARDAMPSGGTLTIQTNTVHVDDAFVRMHAGSSAGEYVRLTVTDTGQGMSADVQAQIFTPFFTTKGPGAGTGLGLATVYRIVQQAGGFITVDSTPGHGASFGIYLPVVNAPVDQQVDAAEPATRPRASGTILLAEDDERIRTLHARALSRRGYTVLPARDAVEAQRIAASHGGRIDLLLTDVVMPGLNGYELAEELRGMQPGLKVLYTSGYTEVSEPLRELQKAGVAFIQKPYAPLALAQKVREVLEG